jgi:hypothetical protein
MKKFLSLFAIAALMVSCDSESTDEKNGSTDNSSLPQTEIFVQGQLISANTAETRGDYKWPDVNVAEGWESARFSIRADGSIPGYIDQSSALYYGRAPGKAGKNKGKVYIMYPYGHYNDRDLDYYQKDKKTGNNIGLFRYVLDQEGMKTQAAIKEAPSLVELLQDEIDDLNAAIAKGQNVTKNQASLDQINGWMALENGAPGYLENHVLWYVVKEVGMKNGWHVNGVFVNMDDPNYVVPKYERTGANVPNNVEVDIHQQVHKDWNEIKTSVHIRTDVESVTINIPLKQEDVIEKDDFAIRIFDFDYNEYHIAHTVTHNENGITIEISNIPADLIQTLKQNFGDGLTVEIHSYCTTKDIWEQLSKSRVVKLGKPCTVNGQISSALRPDEDPVPIYAPNTKK